jgi:EamA-like transporter family
LFIVIFPACFCVLTRALLNVCDRQIFKKTDTDIFKNIVFNSIFPFLIAFSLCFFINKGKNYFSEYLFHPGVILSALGAQLAGCVFAVSFSKIPVKGVIISAKSADLFIPLLIGCITSKFQISDYVFSCLSVLIFLPFLFPLEKTKSPFQLKMIVAIISVLLFQASINSYFCINKFPNTLSSFLPFITCILFWRTVMILIPYIIKSFHHFNKKEIKPTKSTSFILLFFRSIISFSSQTAFFYTITRPSGSLAWPILNTAPLISCLAAHFILHERVGKIEMGILITFTILTIFYLFYRELFNVGMA